MSERVLTTYQIRNLLRDDQQADFEAWLAEHDAKVRAEAYKAAEDAAADALTTWWLQETLPADDTDSVMDVRRAIRAAKAKREAGLK